MPFVSNRTKNVHQDVSFTSIVQLFKIFFSSINKKHLNAISGELKCFETLVNILRKWLMSNL